MNAARYSVPVVLTMAFLCVAAPAHAKRGSVTAGSEVTLATAADLKMDAALRLTLERYAALAASSPASARGMSAHGRLFHPTVPFGLVSAGPGGEPEADVFVRLADPGASGELLASGARIRVQEGDLALVRMPVSRISPLARTPDVLSMAIAREWVPMLDSSRIRSRVRDVHLGAGGLSQAYTGSGVIVGVLDSGLDYTHPDFRISATDSRLLGLFDYSQGANGEECRPGQLDSLTCPEIDGSGGHGHGTHVTGIAAGNGRQNPAYVGMAPQADLLFVKGIRDAQSLGGFSDADIVNGVAWMMNGALAAGKPIAVNLSLGGQLGAHDGTSLQEQFLDRFSGPGRIIVAAAGNSGGDPIHVSYSVQGTDYGSALESGLILTSPTGVVDLWAPPTSNFAVGIAAYDPSDLSTPVFVSPGAMPGQLIQGTVPTNAGALADVVIDARTTADPNNGARNVLILIQPPAGGGLDPRAAVWSVYTFGTGTFDMWAAAGGFFLPPQISVPSYFRAGDDSKTIGIPGTARRIVCVGSHVSKTRWIDVDDTLRIQPNATLDVISSFSSRGPSRDGRVLPNLTAPGEAIISALSKDFPAERRVIVQGGGYQEQQGTSQASPQITGIAALMLQRDPALTPENVRTILQQAATPAGTGNPNNVYGRGRVNALAALQATPDPLGCVIQLPNGSYITCDEAAGQPFSLMAYPNPAPGSMRFGFVTPTRVDVDLAIYDLQGRRARTLLRNALDPGVHSVNWNGADDRGRRLPDGVYFARLLSPTGNRTVRLVLRH